MPTRKFLKLPWGVCRVQKKDGRHGHTTRRSARVELGRARGIVQMATIAGSRPEAEAGFKSLTEAIDTTTVSGTMMMQLIAVFAQFERSVLAERTKAGLDAARKQGRIGGRRPKLRPNQQDEIVTMVSTGNKTAADAARLFNVHPATVSRLLAKAGAGKHAHKVAVLVEHLRDKEPAFDRNPEQARPVAENEIFQVRPIWRDLWAYRPRSRPYCDQSVALWRGFSSSPARSVAARSGRSTLASAAQGH